MDGLAPTLNAPRLIDRLLNDINKPAHAPVLVAVLLRLATVYSYILNIAHCPHRQLRERSICFEITAGAHGQTRLRNAGRGVGPRSGRVGAECRRSDKGCVGREGGERERNGGARQKNNVCIKNTMGKTSNNCYGEVGLGAHNERV